MVTHARAAISYAPGKPFVIQAVEIDDPKPGEVLVRIVGTGLCHTDLVFSSRPEPIAAPAIFGHEGAGIVEKVGAGVTRVAPGDHVVLTFASCGACGRCSLGEPAYCAQFALLNYSGSRPDGTSAAQADGTRINAHFFGQSSFATHALALERNVIAIDRSAPLALMGPLGCGVQTGVGAVMRSLACRAGSSLLILGGGAVGLSAVMGAAVQGCRTIIVIEPQAARREMALSLGATHAFDPVSAEWPLAAREVEPAGLDYALDTTGLKDMIGAAIACLGPHARFGLLGLARSMEDMLRVPINAMVGAGFVFQGIIEGDSEPGVFIPELVALHLAGRLPFDRLIRSYRFEDINQAIADQHAGLCIKPVMLMD